jgi:hypothetical protein
MDAQVKARVNILIGVPPGVTGAGTGKNSRGGGGGANIGRGGGVDAPGVCMDWKKLAMFCI